MTDTTQPEKTAQALKWLDETTADWDMDTCSQFDFDAVETIRQALSTALTPRPAQDGFDKFVEMLDREPQYKPRLAALLKEHAAQTQDSGNEGGEWKKFMAEIDPWVSSAIPKNQLYSRTEIARWIEIFVDHLARQDSITPTTKPEGE